MKRLRSKQNLNPNNRNIDTKEDHPPAKPKIQAKQPLKENPNNPEKSLKKHNKKKQDSKLELKPSKPPAKLEPMPAELYYEQEIVHYIGQQSTINFKKSKQLQQNKVYRAYRTHLIDLVYRQCVSLELKRETFYLYIYFLDSFMKTDAGRKLSLENTTMASYASFLMAQKYEEIYPPSIYQWLSENLHEEVYKWEGKIIFALNFKFIHESLHHFFEYWALKFELKQQEKKSCMILLESIPFNIDLMYKYEPAKIAKAVVLMESSAKAVKNTKQIDQVDPFDSATEKNKIISDITKHITNSKKRIEWISNLRR